MAEPTEMSFGLRTPLGPKNHALDGSPDPPCEEAIFIGKNAACPKTLCRELCKK